MVPLYFEKLIIILLASACWMDFLLLGYMIFTLTLACLVENVYFRNVLNLLKGPQSIVLN